MNSREDDTLRIAILYLIEELAKDKDSIPPGDARVSTNQVLASGWMQLGKELYVNLKTGAKQRNSPYIYIQRPLPKD